jgi:DNA-binding MarR family transcriptional regulator
VPRTVGRGAAPDPDPHLAAAELLEAIRAIERALRVQRAPAAPGRAVVSAAERPLLACLAEAAAPLSLGELAACVHRDPSSVSVVVTRLVARGLVEKRPCPDDRRRCLLRATAAGRRAATHAPDAPGTALARALDAWPERRVRTSARLLTGLARRLADGRPARPRLDGPARPLA